MKQIIKKILLFILQKGYLNFVIGNLKLKFYKELEIKRVPFVRSILYSYYENILKDIEQINCNEKFDSKSRVFFFTNIFPLWEKSTSNFLKINADIANVYIKNGIEVNFILANHSHISYLTNRGIKWKDFMDVNYKQIEDKIKEDLYNMCKIDGDKIKIHILNKYNGNIKLKNYVRNVIDFFNNLNLTREDIIVFSGGVCKSDLLQIILKKICSIKIYLTMGSKENVENCVNYNYILTLNKNLLNNCKNSIPYMPLNLNHFEWEKNASCTEKEKKIIENIEKNSIIFISSKQNYADSIDDEYIDILNYIMLKYNNSYLILIGDSREKIFNKLKSKIKFDSKRIICIDFIDSLYVFFKELNKNFRVFYILPRITGSGVSNLMAACAKIPTTIFKGNDADGNWIPSKYFVETKEEYITQLEEFIKNEKKVEEFINDFKEFRKEKEKISEKFYLELLKRGF